MRPDFRPRMSAWRYRRATCSRMNAARRVTCRRRSGSISLLWTETRTKEELGSGKQYWLAICCATLLAACASGLEEPCASAMCGAPLPPVELIIATTSAPGRPVAEGTLANVQGPDGAYEADVI